MKPFVNRNGIKKKGQLLLIYMENFLSDPRPKIQLKHSDFIVFTMITTLNYTKHNTLMSSLRPC